MTDIIASLQAGDAIELTDAQLLEASLAISDELSSVINGPGIANNVKANAVQLAARVISLSSDPHAPLIEALWTFTAQFGSNYEAYFSAFKEAEEKVEKAAAEVAAANAAAASKKPAVSKGGAPPPSPPPSLISLDDLLNMIPHKQGLDAALSALSGLISTTPSSIIDSIPQSALVQLPKLLRHHSPRIQIRTLVCLKLLLSLNGAHAMSLLSFGAVEELVSLLRSTGKGSIKKASIQVLLTLSHVNPSGPHLVQLAKQEAVKTLVELILSPEAPLPTTNPDAITPTSLSSINRSWDMTQPIPCNPEDLQVSSAALLAYLTTNSSVACRQLMELGGPNIILALIPHNLTQSSDGSKSPVAIPFYPSDGSEPPVIHDAEDLTPLVLSNVTYLLPQGPPTPKPSVDALQTHLLDCLSSLVSSTCNLPAFSAQGWTSVPNHKSDLDGSETSAPLTSPVPLLLGLLDLRVVPPPPAPLPTTPSAAAPKSAGKGTKGGAAPPVAEAPPPPPPPEPFPPSVRASALRCLAQLARISAHAAEISSSMAFRNLVLSSDGETYSPVADMGVVEAVALLLHSLLSFTPGVLGEQEAVHCLKRLAQSIVAAPTEGYAGLGSVQAAKSGVLRAILALPDQGEAVFVAPPRPPPPSPPKSPPPPPLATSQFIWDALGKPEMTDGFKLAAS